MSNAALADAFDTLASLMEIHGENSFKAKAYASASFTISRFPELISGMPESARSGLPFGDSVKKGIAELLQNGSLASLNVLYEKTPPGIVEMLRIKGMGPKKIQAVWHGLQVETIGELEYACGENRLASLKGFGQKTQETILKSIQFYKASTGFLLWKEGKVYADDLISALQTAFPENRFSFTGALRRQVDILPVVELITDAAASSLQTHLEQNGFTVSNELELLECKAEGVPGLKIHLAETKNYFTTLLRTTGSDEFVAGLGEIPVDTTFDSEEAVFEALRRPFVPPALRERPVQQSYPEKLVQPEDIRGLIHCHSKYSDGAATLADMAAAAKERGLEYMVITDHSMAAAYAGGLTPDKVAAQHKEIDALNAKMAPFRIFKSIEADILGDGSLDYGPAVLSTFDIVIASVHSNLAMTQDKAMARVMAAIANPFTAILGHCTGRLLLAREGYPLDHKVIIDACAEHDVVIEINANPRRLDIDWRWIPYALEKGVMLSINPDAHSIRGIDDTFYGVMSAQKGGLPAERNLSSFTLAEMEAFVARQQAKRGRR